MALIKEVISLIILMVISKFFVSGGRIHPSEYERLNERNGDISYEQRNIAIPTVLQDPNYIPDFNPYGLPQYQQFPQYPEFALTTSTPSTTTPAINLRNNFGDLPVKCGPNQEKIDGECHDV